MTGKEMYPTLANMDYTTLIQKVVDKLVDINAETIIVSNFLLFRDLDRVEWSKNAEELTKEILESAEMHGHYAGLVYDPNDFLTIYDADFTHPDDGLSWVAFNDIWKALEEIVEEESKN